MNDISHFIHKLDNDLYVITCNGLEDFRAVISSKVSREIELQNKFEVDKENIKAFLIKNLAGYGHASIAEMSFPTIYHYGFGWINAYRLTDDKLFIGQEVSTRAVDILNKVTCKPCYDALSLNKIEIYFEIFKEIFASLKTSVKNSGYRFDEIRWSLPGAIQTGVISNMNCRVLARNLDRLRKIPEMEKTCKSFENGATFCSPYTFNSVYQKNREVRENLKTIKIIKLIDLQNNLVPTIEWYSKPNNLHVLDQFLNLNLHNRNSKKEYLPAELNELGLFKVKIYCSIAAARDWHRHRPIMPWTLSLPIYNGKVFINPIYSKFGYDDNKQTVDTTLLNISNLLRLEEVNSIDFQDMYYLPFGTVVEMSAIGTLDSIVYMLELRSNSTGANFEYKSQAEALLANLRILLGKVFCDRFYI